MRILGAFGLLVLATPAMSGCSDDQSLTYGGDQPGFGLPEGGEIRHENVRILNLPEQSWVMVYQYTTADKTIPTAPFATPADGGKGKFGNCVDERNGSPTWPFHPITGATYLDLAKVQLSGPGITGALNIAKGTPVNKSGNSTFRAYDFTYGGGAPGNPPAGFNGSLTKEMSAAGGEYTLDIGKMGRDVNGKVVTDTKMTYNIPEAYVAPLGIGFKTMTDPVIIPAGKDLEYSWTTPKNDKGTDGFTHTKKTYFNFTFFADPTNAANPPQFICFPDKDGHQLVPKAVIDELPAAGLIVNANLGHWLEARETTGGEVRRFDLVSIYCNISAYVKQ